MRAKKIKKKVKKRIKINKKNIGFILLYLRTLKIFKKIFTILIIISSIYFFIMLYKNKTIYKIQNDLILTYSRLMYKNICSNIEINGIEKSNINTIQENVYTFCNLENKNDLEILLNYINKDPWIKKIYIKRKIPNTLQINIEEYLPFVIWKDNQKLYLIDETGKIININEKEKKEYYNLLIVAGENSKENIYSLFNLLSSNSELFSKVKSALRIGKRRWNLELYNGTIIKMPEKNILNAWNNLEKILSIKGSDIDLKVIDLRNEDKIFMENM